MKVQKTISDGDFSVPVGSFSGRESDIVGAMVLKPSMPALTKADMFAEGEKILVGLVCVWARHTPVRLGAFESTTGQDEALWRLENLPSSMPDVTDVT